MASVRKQADSLYQLLTDENSNLEPCLKESYSIKLIKAVDILKDDIKEPYYIQKHQVEFWDILEFPNINYIYDKLKSSDFYLGAKEV